MKKTILTIALIVMGAWLFAQNNPLLHTDKFTLNGSEYMELNYWTKGVYFDKQLTDNFIRSVVYIKKTVVLDDTSFNSPVHEKTFIFSNGDTLVNPYTGQEYLYPVVRATILNNGEYFMDTLAKWQVLNWKERLLK